VHATPGFTHAAVGRAGGLQGGADAGGGKCRRAVPPTAARMQRQIVGPEGRRLHQASQLTQTLWMDYQGL